MSDGGATPRAALGKLQFGVRGPKRSGARTVGLGHGIAVAIFATLAAGCSRAPPSGSTDGGARATEAQTQAPAPPEEPPAPPPSDRAPAGLDLRTALYLVLPEFRGIRIQEGEAGVERVLSLERLAPEAIVSHLRPMGFTAPSDDAGADALAVRPPFVVKAIPGTRRVRAVIPMDDEMPGRILQTQSPLGSEAMAALLPPAAPGTLDTFVMDVTYEASLARSAFLVRQLVGGHQATGWRLLAHQGWAGADPDGGAALPEQLSLSLQNEQLGGVLDLQRQGTRVTLRYRQPLRGR